MSTVNTVWRSQGSFWACPKDYNFSFLLWQSFHTLSIHMHLDSLQVANSALWGQTCRRYQTWNQDVLPNHPGKNLFSSSAARGMLEASRSKLHRRILLPRRYGNEKLIFLDWNTQYGFQIQTQMWFPLPSFLVYLESPWPTGSLISQMTEAKTLEQLGPINTKAWEALCKRVFHFYLAFPIETFFSVLKNNPKEDQTGCTQTCP